MAKFFDGYADKITVPRGEREALVFDDAMPGFGIRKFATGKASYFVKYRVGKKQRKLTLGPVVNGNLAAMRCRAANIFADAKSGKDAADERAAAAARTSPTVGELVPHYLKSRRGEVSEEYHYQLTLYLSRYWQPLHSLEIDAVKRGKIVGVLDDIAEAHGRTGADRAKAALSGFFAWAIERSYCELSPVQGIKKRATGGARERVLSESELVAIWRAAGEFDYGRILRLLMLTGQRKTEIGDLEWKEINFDRAQIELPGQRTKNKRAHAVPLSSLAISILQDVPRQSGREFVFGEGGRGYQGWSKAKKAIDKRLPEDMEPWTVHDLRRSFSTHVGENGFAEPHVIEAILNHASGFRASVAGVYNRAVYAKEKRQAVELWANHLDSLLRGAPSNIVPIKAHAIA